MWRNRAHNTAFYQRALRATKTTAEGQQTEAKGRASEVRRI